MFLDQFEVPLPVEGFINGREWRFYRRGRVVTFYQQNAEGEWVQRPWRYLEEQLRTELFGDEPNMNPEYVHRAVRRELWELFELHNVKLKGCVMSDAGRVDA